MVLTLKKLEKVFDRRQDKLPTLSLLDKMKEGKWNIRERVFLNLYNLRESSDTENRIQAIGYSNLEKDPVYQYLKNEFDFWFSNMGFGEPYTPHYIDDYHAIRSRKMSQSTYETYVKILNHTKKEK